MEVFLFLCVVHRARNANIVYESIIAPYLATLNQGLHFLWSEDVSKMKSIRSNLNDLVTMKK